MPLSLRSRGRRALALVVLAGMVAAGGVVGVDPAGADDVPTDIAPLRDNALKLAKRAIANDACAARLNGDPDIFARDSARLVLNHVKFNFTETPPPDQPANAVASTVFSGFTQRPITLHREFAKLNGETPDRNGVINTLLYLGDLKIKVTGDIDRAVAILHEVGHLTGRETHQPLGNPNQAGISDAERQRRQDAANRAEGQYNADILNLCVAPVLLPRRQGSIPYVPIEIVAYACVNFDPFLTGFSLIFDCEARWTGGDDFEVDVRPDDFTFPSDFSVNVPGRTVRFRMTCPDPSFPLRAETKTMTAGFMLRDFDSSNFDFEFMSGEIASTEIVCRYPAPIPPIEW